MCSSATPSVVERVPSVRAVPDSRFRTGRETAVATVRQVAYTAEFPKRENAWHPEWAVGRKQLGNCTAGSAYTKREVALVRLRMAPLELESWPSIQIAPCAGRCSCGKVVVRDEFRNSRGSFGPTAGPATFGYLGELELLVTCQRPPRVSRFLRW